MGMRDAPYAYMNRRRAEREALDAQRRTTVFEDGFERLKQEATATSPLAPAERPARLPLQEVHQEPVVFQARFRVVEPIHLKDLIRELKKAGDLDPIKVATIGSRVVLIDGHHRLAAYQQCADEDGSDQSRFSTIPVEWFEGTLEEAVLEAARANIRKKLPLTNGEKQDFAWALVRSGLYSKREIRTAAGVSDGQIATMRRVLKTIGPEVAKGCPSWLDALGTANNTTYRTWDEDEREMWLERMSDAKGRELRSWMGPVMRRDPELLARTLEVALGKDFQFLIPAILERHPDILQEQVEAEIEAKEIEAKSDGLF